MFPFGNTNQEWEQIEAKIICDTCWVKMVSFVVETCQKKKKKKKLPFISY